MDLALLQLAEDLEQLRNQRAQILQSIRLGSECNDRDVEPRGVLLVSDSLIGGHEDVELPAGQPEDFPVLLTCPAHLGHCLHFVGGEFGLQPPR